MRQVSFFLVSFVCSTVPFERSFPDLSICVFVYAYICSVFCGARVSFRLRVCFFVCEFIRRYSLVRLYVLMYYIWIGFMALPFVYR